MPQSFLPSRFPLSRPSPVKPRPTARGSALALAAGVAAAVPAVPTAAAEPAPIQVVVTAKGCEPMELTVPAGPTTFVITNKSSRALEWEILDGVMVVDERENIAPGFKAKLTTKLAPGRYDITCGLLDNPRGKLIVTGGAASAKPSAADLVGPVAEYRVGTAAALGDLRDAVATLKAADAAGDRAKAEAAFLAAQAAFLSLGPIEGEIAAPTATVAADLAVLDGALYGKGDGRAPETIAKLETDVTAFAAAAKPVLIPADRLIAAARRIAASLAAAPPEAPAASALAAAEAQRGAIERVTKLFAPLAARSDAAAAKDLDDALAALRQALAAAPGPIGGYADARTLSPDVRKTETEAAARLASRLAALPALLGL